MTEATARRNPMILNWTPRPDWMEQAACVDVAPETYFLKDPIEAKATCVGCPVLATCLRYAVENTIDYGVWGGLSEDERKAMKRGPGRPRPGFTRDS